MLSLAYVIYSQLTQTDLFSFSRFSVFFVCPPFEPTFGQKAQTKLLGLREVGFLGGGTWHTGPGTSSPMAFFFSRGGGEGPEPPRRAGTLPCTELSNFPLFIEITLALVGTQGPSKQKPKSKQTIVEIRKELGILKTSPATGHSAQPKETQKQPGGGRRIALDFSI